MLWNEADSMRRSKAAITAKLQPDVSPAMVLQDLPTPVAGVEISRTAILGRVRPTNGPRALISNGMSALRMRMQA